MNKDQVWEMFQKVYFDSVDSGDMERAASIFHEDVEWIHTQVWEHDDYRRSKGSDKLRGRKEVEALLSKRKQEMKRAEIRHVVDDLVLEGNRGAWIGRVEGPGTPLPMIAWFEIKDDKVYRYTITPLFIP